MVVRQHIIKLKFDIFVIDKLNTYTIIQTEMKWTHQTKEMIQYGVAMVCIVFGLVLVAIGGLAIEPIGEVSASFLTCLGVLLTFAGSIFGISAHYNSELVNFKSEIRSKLDEEEVTLKSDKEKSEE